MNAWALLAEVNIPMRVAGIGLMVTGVILIVIGVRDLLRCLSEEPTRSRTSSRRRTPFPRRRILSRSRPSSASLQRRSSD